LFTVLFGFKSRALLGATLAARLSPGSHPDDNLPLLRGLALALAHAPTTLLYSRVSEAFLYGAGPLISLRFHESVTGLADKVRKHAALAFIMV